MIDRATASDLADVLAGLEITGDWIPTPAQRTSLRGLENALATTIQAGQPMLEAMQDAIVEIYAAQLPALTDVMPTRAIRADFSRPAPLPRAA